jgi:two-component system cell cycle response regulator DivK
MRQDERLVREAGCEAYMSKPIQMMPFIDTVKKLTSPRSAPPPRNVPPAPRRAMR